MATLGIGPQKHTPFSGWLSDLEGRLRSAKLALPTAEKPLDFTSLAASYELKDANLRVHDLFGGRAGRAVDAATGKCCMWTRRMQHRVWMHRCKAFRSLARAMLSAHADVRRIPLEGVATMQAQASWTGSLDDLVAHVRLAVASSRTLDQSRGIIPVNGVVQADYDGPGNMISFGQSYLQTLSTKINVAGMLSSRRSGNSDVSVLVTTSDLHEVDELAMIVENAFQRVPSRPPPTLAGSASLHAVVTGTPKNPVIRGQLAARDFEVDGSRWKALAVSLSARPSEVSLQNGKRSTQTREETLPSRAVLACMIGHS